MHHTLKEIIKRSPHLDWMEKGTCFLTLHGSRAYGTFNEDSDYDFKGVAIPPKKYFYSSQYKFEQAELKDPAPDTVIYEIRKFFNLAMANNPSVIEVLFTDPSDHQYANEIGKILLDNKQKFLSKKAKFSFSGYAISQLQRMKLHYSYHNNPIKEPPTRKEFGLPERTLIPKDQLAAANASIEKELDKFNFDFLDGIDEPSKIELRSVMYTMLTELKLSGEDKWLACAKKVGLDDNFIELMQKERAYENKKRDWTNYQTWKTNRNPERAKLEAKYLYDCKNAYHLVRLMKECREILTSGTLTVKRADDREELLAIRNGAWTYEQVLEWAEKEDAAMDELYKTSTAVPHSCNKEELDNLCIELVEKGLMLHGK
jgi:predicted nucleotidyltransferase